MMYAVTSSADQSTFEEFAGTAWPSLYRYAYLLAGNHADAEDIAQQTLLKAHRPGLASRSRSRRRPISAG